MSARSGLLRRDAPLLAKSGFAKRAWDFAKRVAPRRAPPGFPMLWIAGAAATGLMTVTGGFGTGAIPLPARAFFWMLLMGWNLLKWQLWFAALVHRPQDWTRAALIGGVVLTLPLPLEVFAAARAIGASAGMPDLFGTWGRGLAIGAVIFVTLVLVLHATGHRRIFGKTAAAPIAGLLARARIAPEHVLAIEAEDHYCRVRRRDGHSVLVHCRFGDALAELASLDGAQVHRGAWVAAAAVAGARREGRRWQIVLTDGSAVAVSNTYAPEARRRHWLRRASSGAGV